MKWFLRGIIVTLALCFAPFANAQVAAPTLTQTVNSPLVDPSSFTLTSLVNPSLTTGTATYSGVISGASGVVTGTITVCDGGTGPACTGGLPVATVVLNSSGGYTCTETGMSAGSHIITAHYSGDKVYAPSK